jgi:hypothetical protein
MKGVCLNCCGFVRFLMLIVQNRTRIIKVLTENLPVNIYSDKYPHRKFDLDAHIASN